MADNSNQGARAQGSELSLVEDAGVDLDVLRQKILTHFDLPQASRASLEYLDEATSQWHPLTHKTQLGLAKETQRRIRVKIEADDAIGGDVEKADGGSDSKVFKLLVSTKDGNRKLEIAAKDMSELQKSIAEQLGGGLSIQGIEVWSDGSTQSWAPLQDFTKLPQFAKIRLRLEDVRKTIDCLVSGPNLSGNHKRTLQCGSLAELEQQLKMTLFDSQREISKIDVHDPASKTYVPLNSFDQLGSKARLRVIDTTLPMAIAMAAGRGGQSRNKSPPSSPALSLESLSPASRMSSAYSSPASSMISASPSPPSKIHLKAMMAQQSLGPPQVRTLSGSKSLSGGKMGSGSHESNGGTEGGALLAQYNEAVSKVPPPVPEEPAGETPPSDTACKSTTSKSTAETAGRAATNSAASAGNEPKSKALAPAAVQVPPAAKASGPPTTGTPASAGTFFVGGPGQETPIVHPFGKTWQCSWLQVIVQPAFWKGNEVIVEAVGVDASIWCWESGKWGSVPAKKGMAAFMTEKNLPCVVCQAGSASPNDRVTITMTEEGHEEVLAQFSKTPRR